MNLCDGGCCPREVLDGFCCAGGAAEGLHRAWPHARITGVDIRPQLRYPFHFMLADFMEYDLQGYDFIWTSPPCQGYSVANNIHQAKHPLLVPAVRGRLRATGVPWIIENVPGAPMPHYVVICGLALGLNVKRHRWFESSELLFGTPCRGHDGDWLLVFGHTVLERGHRLGRAKGGGPVIRRRHVGTDRGREAMGIDWMTRDELSEAIPPAYSEYLARQLTPAFAEMAA